MANSKEELRDTKHAFEFGRSFRDSNLEYLNPYEHTFRRQIRTLDVSFVEVSHVITLQE